MNTGLPIQKKYRVRKLEVEELALLIPLIKNCFGLQVNPDFLKWKYVDNPAGFFIGFIAEEEESGELAAYYGVIPKVFLFNGKPTTIYQSVDTMTHSQHRRQGLFELLATTCYDYLRKEDKLFIIGFGGDFSTAGGFKFGWQYVDKVYQLFCPRILVNLMGWRNTDYTIKVLTDIDTINELLIESNKHTAIYSLKDAEVYKWRLRNPLHQYQLYGIFLREKLVGYFCYYRYKNRLYLFDCFYKEAKAVAAMRHFLFKKLKDDQSLTGIQSFASTKSYLYKILRRSAFLKSPFKKGGLNLYLSFIFLASEQRKQEYKHPHLWNLTPFDHDTL